MAVVAEATTGPTTLFISRNGSLPSPSNMVEVVWRSVSKRSAIRSVPHSVIAIAKLSAA